MAKRLGLKAVRALKGKSRKWVEKLRSPKLRLLEDETVWDELPVRPERNVVAEASQQPLVAYVEIVRAEAVNHGGPKHWAVCLEGVDNPQFIEAVKLAEKTHAKTRKVNRVYDGNKHVEYIAFKLNGGGVWAEPSECWASSLWFDSVSIFKRHISCEKYLFVKQGDEGVNLYRHDKNEMGTMDLNKNLKLKVYGSQC